METSRKSPAKTFQVPVAIHNLTPCPPPPKKVCKIEQIEENDEIEVIEYEELPPETPTIRWRRPECPPRFQCTITNNGEVNVIDRVANPGGGLGVEDVSMTCPCINKPSVKSTAESVHFPSNTTMINTEFPENLQTPTSKAVEIILNEKSTPFDFKLELASNTVESKNVVEKPCENTEIIHTLFSNTEKDAKEVIHTDKVSFSTESIPVEEKIYENILRDHFLERLTRADDITETTNTSFFDEKKDAKEAVTTDNVTLSTGAIPIVGNNTILCEQMEKPESQTSNPELATGQNIVHDHPGPKKRVDLSEPNQMNTFVREFMNGVADDVDEFITGVIVSVKQFKEKLSQDVESFFKTLEEKRAGNQQLKNSFEDLEERITAQVKDDILKEVTSLLAESVAMESTET